MNFKTNYIIIIKHILTVTGYFQCLIVKKIYYY